MIHEEHNEEKVDQDLIIEYAEKLIMEMKGNDPKLIGSSVMNTKQAIYAASITARRLAQETAKKFYYEVTQYLMDLNE
jgi:hypothetical protein